MTTTLPPRVSGQEPVVEQGRGGLIPTRRYTLYFATTQHWTVQTSVLNAGVQAQLSDLSYRIEGVQSIGEQARAELAALKGDPRLEAGARAEDLALAAVSMALAKQDARFRQEIGELYGLIVTLSQQVAETQQRQQSFVIEAQQNASKGEAQTFIALASQAARAQGSADQAAQKADEVAQDLANLTTSDVPEGANLYFTNARADGRIAAAVGVTVQAYDADLTAFAGKTAPTGAVVGTTDTQTLSNKTLDQLRTGQTATAAAVAQTHHVPVDIGGVTYKLLLAS